VKKIDSTNLIFVSSETLAISLDLQMCEIDDDGSNGSRGWCRWAEKILDGMAKARCGKVERRRGGMKVRSGIHLQLSKPKWAKVR
jgi:hypothetical protein